MLGRLRITALSHLAGPKKAASSTAGVEASKCTSSYSLKHEVNEVVERSEGYKDATICSPFLFFLNACLHRQATVPRITPKVTVMQGSHTPPCLIMAKLIQITVTIRHRAGNKSRYNP